jgi:thiamine transport system ATP-binding protein
MSGVPPAHRPVDMLFQEHNLFPHLSAAANVGLGIRPDLKLTAADRERVSAALARVGLAGFESRLPGQMSGGERQRTAIARCLLRRRPVLLLDEPFASLGPALRRDMLELVCGIQRESGATVLLVTHNPGDARLAATHTAFVLDGRVRACRRTADLFAADDLPELADYLGTEPRRLDAG